MSLDILVIGMHYAPETTGNAPYTTGLVRALHDAGHRVRVVTGYPHYPQWEVAEGYGGLRMREDDHGVPVTRVRHPVPGRPTALSRILMDAAFTAHAMTVRGPRPDVVIAISPVLLTILAGLRRRAPLGVVIQDLYSRALLETRMTSGRVARWASALERFLLRRVAGVAVVHDNFVRNLRDLGIGDVPVTVIPNWSHVSASTADRDRTRAALGWGADELVALHAGNMGTKQGLENVVAAARVAQQRGSRVRFVLLGDGVKRPELEEIGRSAARLQFLRPLPEDEFVDALAAADVLVLNEAPSVAEMSVPSKLTSYFASGRPVLAATHAHSAAAAEIEHSGAGVRVDPGDPEALHDAALALGADPAGADEMGRAGRRYAEDKLSADTAARLYTDWVRTLAYSRASARCSTNQR